ncbi:MAG: NADH-quinone oxidoreductase subunit K, partial [Cytophagales bacterium]|nr:NADH-quinone oxidoreductase subunit K [Cytophagales bacterium]
MNTLTYFPLLGALLFCIGLAAVVTHRNTFRILLGIELMLNASNLNLVAFSQADPA